MGELIMMPVRNTTAGQNDATAGAEVTPIRLETDAQTTVDLSVWKDAPRERTTAYFPTYSAVSRAIQGTLRTWVRGWFKQNLDILARPHTAYAILVYQCTTPFSGRPTNMFTYDIQQTEALNRAFASAAAKLGRELKELDTKSLPWMTREAYFAYRSKEVVKYVSRNRRGIYKMLNVETVLMDSILKFTQIDIPKLGFDAGLVNLRRAFRTQLNRLSDEFDFSDRSEDLLRVATEALSTKLSNDKVVAFPIAA